MCVICIRNPATNPTDDEQVAKWLRNCLNSNRDGAGVAWPTEKGGKFVKGLNNIEDILTILKTVPTDVPTVVHFRIGTQGAIDAVNTHPFVIHGSGRDASKLEGVGAGLMVHNGIIQQMPYSNIKSDTRLLADRLLDLPEGTSMKTKIHIVQTMVGGGKYAFINKQGVKYVGKFMKPVGCEDWMFSNTSYQDPLPVRTRMPVIPGKYDHTDQFRLRYPYISPDNQKMHEGDPSKQDPWEEEDCLFCELYGHPLEYESQLCALHVALINGYEYNALFDDPSDQLRCPACNLLEEWDASGMTEDDIEELCGDHQIIIQTAEQIFALD